MCVTDTHLATLKSLMSEYLKVNIAGDVGTSLGHCCVDFSSLPMTKLSPSIFYLARDRRHTQK